MAGEQPASLIDGGRSDSRSSSVCANELIKLLWRVAAVVVIVADASVAVGADVVVVVAVTGNAMFAVVAAAESAPVAMVTAAAAAVLAFASAEGKEEDYN